jgi:outer membrane protein
MRRLLVIALLLPALARAENLLEIYAQARAADPVLAAADAARGVQQELAVQARAKLLPQWSASASEYRLRPDDSSGNTLASHISQTLVDLGQLRSLDAAQAQVHSQDAQLRAAEQDLRARVASAYFGVLSAQASLATAEANESAFAQQVEQAQSRFKAGLSAAVDVEQARAYAQLARGATVQARQSLADAREALAQITGRSPGTLQPLVADLPALPPQPALAQAWVDRALAGNPALISQQRQVEASGYALAAARAAHLPTLSLGVDTTRQRGTGAFLPSDLRTNTQLGLTLNIPIFAGGATQSQVRQASLQRESQRDQAEIVRRALVREVNAEYQAVLAGVAQMEAGRAAVEAADKAVESTRAGQELGTRTMTDLLLGIQTQAQAQNAYEQARHRYVLATLLLQQAAGSLGDAELAAVNSLLKD